MSASPKYGDGDLPYGLTVAEDGAYLDWRGEHYTRTIERAPERAPVPGADIPDEVVDEALDSFMNALEGHERPKGLKVRNFMRAALAAADAKRAELDGGKVRMDTAGEWVQRIDRDKLAEVLDRGAVLDALPDLMKGESDE